MGVKDFLEKINALISNRMVEEASAEEKDFFYTHVKELLEENLIKEIYAGKSLSIMNVANSCYVVFVIRHALDLECIFGFIMDPESILKITKSEAAFHRWVKASSKETLKKFMLIVNETNINVMRELKAKTDVSGPTKDIDLQMESMLKA